MSNRAEPDFILDPDHIPESPLDEERGTGLNWGDISIMGGSIRLQFIPLDIPSPSARLPILGRNGACLDEVKEIVDDLALQDIKRTVRTILR